MKNSFSGFATLYQDESQALSLYYISENGRLIVLNTGGTGASEGGMGSGNQSGEEKGTVSKPEGSDTKTDEKEDNGFDPLKKDIEKAQEEDKPKR